jgi:hypothetical protein
MQIEIRILSINMHLQGFNSRANLNEVGMCDIIIHLQALFTRDGVVWWVRCRTRDPNIVGTRQGLHRL